MLQDHFRHRHSKIEEIFHGSTYVVKNGSNTKHGHHFYGRHKRKFHKLEQVIESIHWPIKKEATMEGHVILGGLMMVHEREDNMTCGPIMPQGGIQALEAMLFTLDRINNMKLLKNFTIGAHILDDCDKDTYGLEMAVDFIKGKLKRRFCQLIVTKISRFNETCLRKHILVDFVV
jgi:Receptor family ligand binding region